MFQFFILTVSLLLWPMSAYAYIDPGTGAMVLQLLIAGIVAALATVKMWWYRGRRFINNILKKKPRSHE